MSPPTTRDHQIACEMWRNGHTILQIAVAIGRSRGSVDGIIVRNIRWGKIARRLVKTPRRIEITDLDRRIAHCRNVGLSYRQTAGRLSISMQTVSARIKKLKNLGAIEPLGPGHRSRMSRERTLRAWHMRSPEERRAIMAKVWERRRMKEPGNENQNNFVSVDHGGGDSTSP